MHLAVFWFLPGYTEVQHIKRVAMSSA